MTSDTVHDNQLQWKARLGKAPAFTARPAPQAPAENGLELTRMQNFLDGRQDIFDVLENHAANSQMKIRIPNKRYDSGEDDLSQSSLFRSLWTKLRSQMNELGSDFSNIRD